MDLTMSTDTKAATILHVSQHDATAYGWRTFRSALLRALERGSGGLVVDLRPVRFIFSGVLNALTEARVEARRRGESMVILVDEGELRELLVRCGFDRLFVIAAAEGEALAAAAA